MKDILLITGNGLSVDLCRHTKNKFNTNTPLSWEFDITQENENISWKNAFPELNEYCKKNLPVLNNDNFELFRNLRKNESIELRQQARLFLGFAYTHFMKSINIPLSWKWNRFVRKNSTRIGNIISFNYDSILESIVSHKGWNGLMGKEKVYVVINRENEINLLKPHGCHTMGLHPNIIRIENFKYPNGENNLLVFEANDTPYYQIPPLDLMKPRIESYCILPHEENIFQNYQWQGDSWNDMPKNHSKIRHCLIIGHSYGQADRPEIDRIILSLPKTAIIHICNPFPGEDLVKNASKNGNRIVIHKDLAPYNLDNH